MALLEAIDRYPQWHPGVVNAAEVLERDAHEPAIRTRTTAADGQRYSS
jgi:hypothetical protein